MIAKIHEIEYRTILAVCDKEHIGKEFEDGKIFFKASEKFYNGKKITKKELEELLQQADSINLFGNKCVEIALQKQLISEKNIILIKGIKHAQIYRV
ncbi:MAG: DUF424 family protein [Candidatus ainarchaeum sp.]|jgi:hypothetical protein|nr:DUF424 family protein [Candidatus ainarchaeum sp.]MDD3085583.1 DUF424 family protein [Candidatus ainarchaeum sp.]MDD4128353.1 DUF424 family protein [Candidatus ainarchaeum sp.]MDD4467849.1 DUF424 family protein [Candidatus ainarchaeum sp.]HPM86102.1 DUF424 family protein [archaeon]